MSTSTTNLGLTKAGAGEAYDLAVVNTNLDLVDTAIGFRAAATSTTTIQNTTNEQVLATLSLPAAAAGANFVYQLVTAGQAGVTGTPTLTLRARIGGLTGALLASIVITPASGVSGKNFKAIAEAICVSTGVSGTWLGSLTVIDELNTTLPNAADVNVITTPVTKDTTVAQDLVITAQWSAANVSNTISRYYRYGNRVA